MISASISSHKIDKALVVVKGDKRYLNVVFFENDKPDQYGNDGIIKQSLTKEQRAAGTQAPIVGNWKWMNKPAAPKGAPPAPAPAESPAEDDVPF
ncbi:MAG: hypothetical protein E6Q97_38675 [Desulfurellales bacterium]|nr:MAG: hypothetical protein E6Q97_38675 [Desulfurellales bacterium]